MIFGCITLFSVIYPSVTEQARYLYYRGSTDERAGKPDID